MSGKLGKGLYATLRWQHVRKKVFARDNYRCRLCGSAGRLECDHIVPLRAGGNPFELRNLQTLCRSCHIKKSARFNRKPDSPDVAAWRKKVREIFNDNELKEAV